jgi:hypothetical protein
MEYQVLKAFKQHCRILHAVVINAHVPQPLNWIRALFNPRSELLVII